MKVIDDDIYILHTADKEAKIFYPNGKNEKATEIGQEYISKEFMTWTTNYVKIDHLIRKMFELTDMYEEVDRFIQVTDPTSIDLK
jgi:hypothetical protein